MSTDPSPVPVHVTIATLADLGHGRTAIARHLGMTEAEVQAIADAHGITLRRRGHPGLPEADRLGHRITVRFTPAEYAAIVAAAIDAGTTPPAWLRAVGAAAAEGQSLRTAAEAAAARAGGAR